MNQVTLLRDTLRPHLAWHGARLSFVAAFLIALVRVKTVNLAELATAFSGQAQTDSHYKRLQRFFRSYELNYAEMAQAVVTLMNIPEPWVLSLDRTEWQFGDCVFNILMLGVVDRGIAFPVVWTLLDKHGNSNSDERMILFDQFLERFGEREFACLTADREFVGKSWFGYLLTAPRTPFRIRIRANHKLSNGQVSLKIGIAFADLAVGQTKILRHKRRLWGHWVYIAALRLEDNSLLVVATQSAPKSAISDYAKRWSIETLFGIFARSWILPGIDSFDRWGATEQAFGFTLISLMLGYPLWRMAPSAQAIDDQKAWTQSQEYFPLWLRPSPLHCSQFRAKNG